MDSTRVVAVDVGGTFTDVRVLDQGGAVLTELDEDEAREVARILAKREVETVAVCFVNAYANGEHEQRMAEILKEADLDLHEAADAIIAVANANMADAVRIISLQRGYDPREFALVVFGGAGPLHGAALAKELGVPTVLVPPRPGTWSALGCLMVDIRHDLSEMFLRPAADADADELGDEGLVTVKVKLTIEGDEIEYDLSGSDPAIKSFLNSGAGVAFSGAIASAKTFLPEIPLNSGFYRAIKVNPGPEGTIVNAGWPNAVTGSVSGAYEKIMNAGFELWSQLMPERAMACCFDLEYLLVGGRDGQDCTPNTDWAGRLSSRSRARSA